MSASTQFRGVQGLHGTSRLLTEGGQPIALLPAFSFSVAGRIETMDLLLVPFAHSGYTTRLFYERPICERAQNWTEHCLIDRVWWTPSWNNVGETLPWREMLCAHLRAVA